MVASAKASSRCLVRHPKAKVKPTAAPTRTLQRSGPPPARLKDGRLLKGGGRPGRRFSSKIDGPPQSTVADLESSLPSKWEQKLKDEEADTEEETMTSTTSSDSVIRKRRRLEHSFNQGADGGAGGITLLEAHAVSAPVRAQYRSLLFRYAGHLSLDVARSDDEVDNELTHILNMMFLAGEMSHTGKKLMAAFLHYHPQFNKQGGRNAPRAWRCLQGWCKLAPPTSRCPVAYPVICAISCYLAEAGFVSMGLALLLAHFAYLRPVELMRLRRVDLVPPLTAASPSWALLLAPSEVGVPTKVGVLDDSVMLDHPEMLWMESAFRELRRPPLGETLWDFTYPQLCREIRKVNALLGTQLVPYQARHSGPSWDRLCNTRTLESIQKRGRWKAFASVQRYEKAARVLSEYAKYQPEQRAVFEVCQREVKAILLGHRKPPHLATPLGHAE